MLAEWRREWKDDRVTFAARLGLLILTLGVVLFFAVVIAAFSANAARIYRVEADMRNEFMRMVPVSDDVFRIEIEHQVIKIEEPVR